MPYGGIYGTNINKCALPHYKSEDHENDEVEVVNNRLYKNWQINRIFENEVSTYRKYGTTLSSSVSGMCLADLFYQYGIYMKDDYMKSVFTNVSCFRGKDTSFSYMKAGRPYKLAQPIPTTATSVCSESVVFPKGCLIMPRGELLWSLLSIPAERIATTDDPNNFRIYFHTIGPRDPIGTVDSAENEFKKHADHLGMSAANEQNKTEAGVHYVTLNPFIYMRIKAYKCMSPENKSLEDQYFMIHKMNLLYTQTLAAMSLISVEAKRLLMYPPATKESICSDRDTLYVGVTTGDNGNGWSLIDGGANKRAKNDGYTYTTFLPRNTIHFPEAKSGDECQTTNNGYHNFIQQYERAHITKIREEYVDLIMEDIGIPDHFDSIQKRFWYKLIKNTHPTRLMNGEETVCTYTHNCVLTPLGVVASRPICENDPLIFDIHTMQIDQLNVPNAGTAYQCNLERLDMPEYSSITDTQKHGEHMYPNPKVQANPLSFNSQFVTSLGTNITILPTQ